MKKKFDCEKYINCIAKYNSLINSMENCLIDEGLVRAAHRKCVKLQNQISWFDICPNDLKPLDYYRIKYNTSCLGGSASNRIRAWHRGFPVYLNRKGFSHDKQRKSLNY